MVLEAFAAVLRAAPGHARRYAAFRDLRAGPAALPWPAPATRAQPPPAGEGGACGAWVAGKEETGAATPPAAPEVMDGNGTGQAPPSESATSYETGEGAARPGRSGGAGAQQGRNSAGPAVVSEKEAAAAPLGEAAAAAAAREVYMRAAVGEWGALDRYALNVEEAFSKSSWQSVFFSSKPHVGYAAKTVGQASGTPPPTLRNGVGRIGLEGKRRREGGWREGGAERERSVRRAQARPGTNACRALAAGSRRTVRFEV